MDFDNNNTNEVSVDNNSTISNDSSHDNLFKGCKVVLVEDDNPWYNKEEVPDKYIPSSFTIDDNPYKQDVYLKQGKYKTNIRNMKSLEKTHSFLERKLIAEQADKNYGIENFNKETNDNMNRNILIILIVILIIIYLYKRK